MKTGVCFVVLFDDRLASNSSGQDVTPCEMLDSFSCRILLCYRE